MARLTPRFSANRAVREYTDRYYLPAAAAYRERAADGGAVGRQMVDWQQGLEEKWAGLHFGEVKVETRGDEYGFEVEVYLGDLDPNAVRVELYADGADDGSAVRQEMERARRLDGASGGYVFGASLPVTRPATGYTARVIPHCEGVAVSLEEARILWQR